MRRLPADLKLNDRPADRTSMAQDIRLIRQIVVTLVLAAVVIGIIVAATHARDDSNAATQSIVCTQPGAETDPDCQ